MSFLRSLCLRCPDDDAATLCSSNVNKPESLAKCTANSAAAATWPGFVNDPQINPADTLPDAQKCQYFVVDVYKSSGAFLKKMKKGAEEEQLKTFKEWKSQLTQDCDGVEVAVSKQLLEYAYSQSYKGKQKEKKVSTVGKSKPSLFVPASSSKPAPTLSAAATSSSSTDTQDLLHKSTAGLSQLTLASGPSSSNTTSASNSGQDSPPFGKFLKSNTTKSQCGATSPGNLGLQPAWKCATPLPYNKGDMSAETNCPEIQSIRLLEDEIDKYRTGAGGKNIQVVTNYVQVQKLPKRVYEYSISYGTITQTDKTYRNVTQRAQKEQIFKALRDMNPLHGNNDWATDYTAIWSLKPLQDPSQPSSSSHEPVEGESFTTERVDFHKFSGKQSSLTGVTFSFTRRLDFPNESRALVSSNIRNEKGAPVHITALNALISSKVASSGSVISTGPNKFFSRGDFDPFLAIQAHRGYFTSIRPGTENILLNVGTMTGAFYQPLRVSEFITATNNNGLKEYGNEAERCKKLLVGRSVRILYDRASHETVYDANLDANRHRIIVEIGKKPSQQYFTVGKITISVMDYFQKELRASPAPSDKFYCVNVGAKESPNDIAKGSSDDKPKPTWIPAEYVALDPDQPFARTLASEHQRKLHNFAVIAPSVTREKIVKNGFNLLGLSENRFAGLDIKIVPELLLIPARALTGLALLVRNSSNGHLEKRPSKFASWNLTGAHFHTSAPVRTPIMALDFRNSYKGGSDLDKIPFTVTNAMKANGMKPPTPTAQSYWGQGDLASDYTDEELTAEMNPLQPRNTPGVHVVILPDTDKDSYATVKRVFDQHIGSHTVCFTVGKLAKANPQFWANLCLKFNLKLGGVNHLPALEGTGNNSAFTVLGRDTMVVGADVSHSPSHMRHCPSVAALVASEDSNYANFPGSMRLQASKQEFLEDLSGMMVERLLHYAAKNHQLPKKIIFFRDGVGEDMYDRVQDQEISQINSAYQDIRNSASDLQRSGRLPANFQLGDSKPQLTFIIVGKRHNTRFFPNGKSQADNKGNVLPGLIVDRVIARPKLNNNDQTCDFFLQSHAAIQGTARAGHYVVLQRGAFNIQQIQNLTHAFCYNYARATKGVSYAGPAYYADRLADRGTLYLRAYTKGKSEPEILMSDAEKDMSGQDGARAFERRVALHVQGLKVWNPRVDDPVRAGGVRRVNPWHPRLDGSMFWL